MAGRAAKRKEAGGAGRAAAPTFPRPLTSVDVVAFTVLDDALQVLLVRRPTTDGEPFPGRAALPGGFVDVARDADLVACARRTLRAKTTRVTPYLEQLGSWGGATRDPRGWSATHAYLALLPKEDARPPAAEDGAARGEWQPVDAVLRRGGLAFDHREILAASVERLRGKAEYTSLPAFLLAEPFTLPQLQRAYEVVLARPVDKSAFRTRMLAAGFLEESGFVEGDSNRPAMGYRLRAPGTPVVFPRTFSPRG